MITEAIDLVDLNVYHLRVTYDEPDIVDRLIELVKQTVNYRWIYWGVEGDTSQIRPHIHFTFATPKVYQTKIQKQELTAKIKEAFTLPGGNKTFYFTDAKNIRKSCVYTVKEDQYGYAGQIPYTIESLRIQSYAKSKHGEFAEELGKLENLYYEAEEHEMSFQKFKEEYLMLKLKYNHKIVKSQFETYLNTIYLKKNPQAREQFLFQLRTIDNIYGKNFVMYD